MVGIDTTFLVDLFRGDKKALKLMEKLGEREEHLSTTVINLAELYRGAYLHKDKERKLREIEELENLLIISGYENRECKNLWQTLLISKRKRKNGERQRHFNCCHFLSYGENKIITRDKKHFEQIEEIEVVSY